jgi:hypothetical protein
MLWTRRENGSVFSLKNAIFETKTAFFGSIRAENKSLVLLVS